MKSVSYADEKKWERLQRMRRASKKKSVRDKVEEARLKGLEKASVLDASDDPADQDKAREIRVMHDYASLKKQKVTSKKPLLGKGLLVLTSN